MKSVNYLTFAIQYYIKPSTLRTMQKVYLLPLLSFALLTACNSNPSATDQKPAAQDTVMKAEVIKQEITDYAFHKIIVDIPSPKDLMAAHKKAGIPFNKEILNPLSNNSKYETSSKKALNYGVYLVDLLYIANYKQQNELLQYLVTTRKMADGIGAAQNFDAVAGSARIDANRANVDSLNTIIDAAYVAIDKYLSSNQRLEQASFAIIGSWTESQYITMQSIKDRKKDKNNAALFDYVLQQKLQIGNIQALLDQYKDNAAFQSLIEPFNTLALIYKPLNKTEDISPTIVTKLSSELEKIRTSIIE